MLEKIVSRFNRSQTNFLVARISRRGHHYFSILASRDGFEYVFRNGHDRWSTISPSFAKRILERNQEKISSRKSPMTPNDYLKMATDIHRGDSSQWKVSKPILYSDREEALRLERTILDLSWTNADGDTDEI